MMTREKLMEEITIEMLREMVNECHCWDGSLEYCVVYDFDDEFFKMFFAHDPMEAVRSAFFGNIKSWMDEYIYFNGYGNIVSMNKWEYEELLEDNADDIIDRTIELYQENHIYLSTEIECLLDEYLNSEVE